MPFGRRFLAKSDSVFAAARSRRGKQPFCLQNRPVALKKQILPKCPGLEKRLQRYAMELAMQSTQLAACNRLHDVEERLARWLLMSHERIGNGTMPLTQEFLGQMLGTRRSSVSVAASILQKAGMITYTRGNVTIVDKLKLAEAACDCYQIIQDQKTNWQAETR